jgi:hypothetical protein
MRTPIKLTTSGWSKLTPCFAGGDFQFMSVQAVHNIRFVVHQTFRLLM